MRNRSKDSKGLQVIQQLLKGWEHTGGQQQAARVHPALWYGLSYGLMACAYLVLIVHLMPNASGRLGHDYSLYFPNLLAGQFAHLATGWFSIPWFTPAFCGGISFFADPNVPWYSVPQWLTFQWGPLRAIQTTTFLFASLGYLGTAMLARQAFGLSHQAAAVGGALFMTNGMYFARMFVGHLSFHAFMLLPLMAAAVLWRTAQDSARAFLCKSAVAAVCLALMLEAGMVHAILPALVSLMAVVVLHALAMGTSWRPWVVLGTATLWANVLAGPKLISAVYLTQQFPRAHYPLAGMADPGDIIVAAWRGLFGRPLDANSGVLSNTPWLLDQHEWDYGVAPVSLLLMAAWACTTLWPRTARNQERRRQPALHSAGWLVLLSLLMLVPLVLNIHHPAWTELLKQWPVFKNSANLVRWFSTYILVAVILACLAFDRLSARMKLSTVIEGLIWSMFVVSIAWWLGQKDTSLYARQDYDPRRIEAASQQARDLGRALPISHISGVWAGQADPSKGMGNDALVMGRSQRACYQPLFGYRLEKFPRTDLHAGPVLGGDSLTINLMNPACQLFPVENGCRPGNLFSAQDPEAARSFLQYQGFQFQRPATVVVSVWMSGLAWTLALLAVARAGVSATLRRARGRKLAESTGEP